ncbi:MAG: DUF3892 domain-containing protein [Oligoflexia bacterium]|nr:DUF3892 domain-containing protein [Oligoflexia bacterium]
MPKYIKAEPGPGKSVIYTDSNGNQWRFDGGSRAWRNQNPGDLVSGKVSKRNGAIGAAGGFAVFPDYDDGHAALLDSLKNEHGNQDIPSSMKSYAPKFENETEAYIAFVRKKTGVKGDKKVRGFSATEFEKLWRAIEQMEGWGKKHEGKITRYAAKAQITAVKKDKKGTIQAYQIEGYGWVSKNEGIRLTRQGKVNAVVVSSRGSVFLRARPNHEIADNLGNKG